MAMSFALRCCLATAISGAMIVGVVPSSQAAITAYTSKMSFEAALAPGYFSEPDMYGNYPNYAGNGFSYTLAASGGKYIVPLSNDISTLLKNPSYLDFSFGPGIKALGGYFYGDNASGIFQPSTIDFSLLVPSGTFADTGNSTSNTSFFGFISDEPLTSASVQIPSQYYVAAGSVIVGTTPPVPGALPVVGITAAFGWSRRLRQRLAATRN
jgi:hypothetical protein